MGHDVWCRRIAALTAVVGWFALILQLVIVVQKMAAIGQGFGPALWRFLGFFTVLTNLGVAIVATEIALGGLHALTGARARLTTVVSILLVGIIYALLLRHVWNPEGTQLLADRLLHQAVPVLFLIVWLVGPHGRLRLADTVWAMAPPLAYLVYALARGEADGWYAYWFLDPAKLGAEKMAQNAVVLALVFCGTALLFIGIDRAIGHRRG